MVSPKASRAEGIASTDAAAPLLVTDGELGCAITAFLACWTLSPALKSALPTRLGLRISSYSHTMCPNFGSSVLEDHLHTVDKVNARWGAKEEVQATLGPGPSDVPLSDPSECEWTYHCNCAAVLHCSKKW